MRRFKTAKPREFGKEKSGTNEDDGGTSMQSKSWNRGRVPTPPKDRKERSNRPTIVRNDPGATGIGSPSQRGGDAGLQAKRKPSGHRGNTRLYRLAQMVSLCCTIPSKAHFINPWVPKGSRMRPLLPYLVQSSNGL